MQRNGYSLLELLFAIALIVTVMAIAAPPLLAALDDQRAAGAARYTATRIQKIRMEAITRSTSVAMRFVQIGSGYEFAVYADGDGDGVRSDDLGAIDRRLGAAEHLSDNFTGVDFGMLPALPPVEPGDSAPGTDPIKLGASNLLSFSPEGTSSSGSLYVRGGGGAQYVIRIYGDTGRTRILKFDVRRQTWRQL